MIAPPSKVKNGFRTIHSPSDYVSYFHTDSQRSLFHSANSKHAYTSTNEHLILPNSNVMTIPQYHKTRLNNLTFSATYYVSCGICRGGGAYTAGPALAGPIDMGSSTILVQ